MYYNKYRKYKHKYLLSQLSGSNDIKLLIPQKPNSIITNSFKLLDGNKSKSDTKTKLNWDDNYLHLEWISYPNITNINNEKNCNQPETGFTSDMAEIYICPADSDCQHYLEVEINPRGILWIALDYNKGGDRKFGLKRKFIDCKKSGVIYNSLLKKSCWESTISIPWKLIFKLFNIKPKLTGSEWKINLFCVRNLKNTDHCTGNKDCEYTLLNPTFETHPANFHVTKSFIKVKLTN